LDWWVVCCSFSDMICCVWRDWHVHCVCSERGTFNFLTIIW
jgi:hypothetical protein